MINDTYITNVMHGKPTVYLLINFTQNIKIKNFQGPKPLISALSRHRKMKTEKNSRTFTDF